MPLPPLNDPLPLDLLGAERLVEAYGAWSARRGRSTAEVRAVRLALYRLPVPWRVALEVLYVPGRPPIEARMRRLGLTPRTLRERQVAALTALRNLMPLVHNTRHPDNRGQR